MWREFLFVLDQFGSGGGGDPGNNAVRFLLALFFWTGLAIVSHQQYRRLGERRDFSIFLAAAFGGSREALMFLLEYGAWRGWLPTLVSYRIFPPLEHSLTDIGRILLGFAYLRYFLPGKDAGRTYLRAGLAVFVGLYLLTAPLWLRFLYDHAGMYAQVGADFALSGAISPTVSPLPCFSASSSSCSRAPLAPGRPFRRRYTQGSSSSSSTSS